MTTSTSTAAAAALDLRPYQSDALAAVDAARDEQARTALIVLPTGCGKTIIFSEMVRRWDVPTLILAHREELLTQARDKLRSIWPDVDAGIVGGGFNEPGRRVTIASVQSMSRPRRLASLSVTGVQLVIVDEAHHTPAASYQRILDAMGAGKPGGGSFLVGVTATPQRFDEQSLANIYGAPVYVATLPQMILDGWLCDLRGVQVRTSVSLDGVHIRAGDFAEGELAAAVDTPSRNRQIVEAWQQRAAGRPTIAFCSSVAHAYHLADAFTAAEFPAAVVEGGTERDVRRDVLAGYAAGRVQVVCNCSVLTEGFDHPETGCIIMARPTKSQGLFIQMVGRGARPAPGKTDCLVLDIVDASRRHKLVQLPDLIGREYPKPVRLVRSGENEREGGRDGFSIRAVAEGPAKLRDVQLVRQWEWEHTEGGNYTLAVGDAILLLEGTAHGFTAWRIASGRQERLTSRPLPLGWAQSLAERAAELLEKGQAHLVDRGAPWRRLPATDKQVYWLQKKGIPHAPNITKGEASDLLAVAFAERSA